jgi:YD repeat-containing protein
MQNYWWPQFTLEISRQQGLRINFVYMHIHLLKMTYPDGETVNYSYNQGGLLKGVTGSKNSVNTFYVDGIRYDNLHNITRKTQDIVQQNLKFTGILSTGYNLSYTYADNSQQIANIADASYRADRSSGAISDNGYVSKSL